MKRRPIFMTGGQLQVAMAQMGWNVDQAADRLGQRRERILDWLHDGQPIPRWLPILFTALTVPAAFDKFEQAHAYLNRQEHNNGLDTY